MYGREGHASVGTWSRALISQWTKLPMTGRSRFESRWGVIKVETPTGENIHSMHKDNSLGWATDIPSSTSGLKWLRSLGRLESFNTGIIRCHQGVSSVEESNAPSVPHGRKGDYKEHGTRNKDESSLRRDETALSSPSLSSWSTPSSRSRDERSSSSSGSNDSGLSSRSSSSSGSPSSTSEKYSNSGNVETVLGMALRTGMPPFDYFRNKQYTGLGQKPTSRTCINRLESVGQ
uniref:(California timema) hypothetical protein n=1 Tax=Timema californicum TaxID=61474 RepID=A0A7R9JCD7_TIMCA|nr:unnamed protein product [Timema californicum]